MVKIDKNVFKGRCQKVARAGHFLLDLDEIRKSEEIEGQYPRWRDVFPHADLPGYDALAYDQEVGLQLAKNVAVRLSSIMDASPVMADVMNKTIMTQYMKHGVLLAESGARPWITKGDDSYTGILIMPVSECKYIFNLPGFPEVS